MTRNRERTTQKATQYTPEHLALAVREVQSGKTTIYRASKVFRIPYNTLDAHVKGRRGVKSTTMGRPTALSSDVERKIADGIREMEKNGLGMTRKDVMNLVGEYVKQNKIQTPFKDGIPQSDWFSAFSKRNNLSLKKPQSVEIARRLSIDPFIIHPYFNLLSETIKELGLENKPHLIYNLDESGFSRDPSKTKIVGQIGYPATRTVSSSGRDNTSVLLAVNAAGGKLPPLILFKGKNVWDDWLPSEDKIFPGMSFGVTKNGWMDSSSFHRFFTKIFIPALGNERPALLICDGHKSHVSLSVIEEARRENITILILPPHSSHILQPLDLSVMKSLKDAWDFKLVEWQKRNFGQKLKKSIFITLFSTLWTELKPAVIMSGFQKGGIYPFSRHVIPENSYDPAALRRWNMIQQADKHKSASSLLQQNGPVAITSSATSVQENSADRMIGNSLTTQHIPLASGLLPTTADGIQSPSLIVQYTASTSGQVSTSADSIITRLSNGRHALLDPHQTSPGINELSDTQTCQSEPPASETSEKTFQQLLLETVKQSAGEVKKKKEG